MIHDTALLTDLTNLCDAIAKRPQSLPNVSEIRIVVVRALAEFAMDQNLEEAAKMRDLDRRLSETYVGTCATSLLETLHPARRALELLK